MATRRGFLASILATATLPTLTWADAGGPSFLAAAKIRDGTFALFGLTLGGQETFRIALPARAHAGAAHPARPEAIVFARRPGTFALVIDCAAGRVADELTAPDGQHFSGHGVYSKDGDTLFTGEVDNLTGAGQIGVWARSDTYKRVTQFSSGGIGPHEILRLPGQEVLAVANGGIVAALDDNRTKLNIDTMQPNLTYLSATGDVLDQMILPPELHKNSIRHLAASRGGEIAFAMQWEGYPNEIPALVGLHRIGQDVRLLDVPEVVSDRMTGYVGSIAWAEKNGDIAVSCPKGGVLILFTASGDFGAMQQRPDVCGLSASSDYFIATDGYGGIVSVSKTTMKLLGNTDVAWDNHLISI